MNRAVCVCVCQVSDCLAWLDKVDLQVVYFYSYNHQEMFGDGNFSEPSHLFHLSHIIQENFSSAVS